MKSLESGGGVMGGGWVRCVYVFMCLVFLLRKRELTVLVFRPGYVSVMVVLIWIGNYHLKGLRPENLKRNK